MQLTRRKTLQKIVSAVLKCLMRVIYERGNCLPSAPWCTGCKTLKAALITAGIGFTEVDIDTPEGYDQSQRNLTLKVFQ